MKHLKLILWPFSFLYGSIMLLRNYLYDHKILPSRRFELPVLAVGNLTVGGTGKTPHVEYLLRLLHKYKTATLSRGYKRTTKGFILAGPQATATTLGDEPFQYHTDFPDVAVAVCEDRVKGIELLQEEVPHLEVVVLDDAMQHRPVEPSLNILISDYYRPFYRDLVMPAGLLREPKKGAKRADAVIMSKCPADLVGDRMQAIRQRIGAYTRKQIPVFFTTYAYGSPVAIGLNKPLGRQVVLLTGIANADPLVQHLLFQNYTIRQHLAYPDHHAYTVQDLQKLQQLLAQQPNQDISILTTRKDAVKMIAHELQELTAQLPVFYVPIEVRFLEAKEKFDELVTRHVTEQVALRRVKQVPKTK